MPSNSRVSRLHRSRDCSIPQILAVNGTTLLSLSYDEALRLLQSTGKTVELVVSQIFHRARGGGRPNDKQNSYQNVDDNNERRRNSRIDNRFIEFEATRERTGANNFEQTYRDCTLKDIDKLSGRRSTNANATDSRLLSAKSLPDLPKVCTIFTSI